MRLVSDEPLTDVEQELAEVFAIIDATNRTYPRYYYCWTTRYGSMLHDAMRILPFMPKAPR